MEKNRAMNTLIWGWTPLSNVGESRFSFIGERVARFIFEYGDRFYAFQGLRSYKNKYVTKWSAKYTAYRKRTSLVDAMILVTMTVNQKHLKKDNRRNLLLPRFLQLDIEHSGVCLDVFYFWW